MTQELIVGLDIGTTKVCAVVGEVRDQQLDIVGIGTAPTAGGLRKGVVVNIDTTVRAIRKAVEEAETMAGCEIRSVYTGVAGAHIQGHNSHGVIVIKDREVTPLEVERVVESAKLMVSVPSDRAVIHTLVQEFLIDGQDGIKDPVGIHGVRLECRVHIVTAAVNALNNIVKCTNKAGLEVSGIALQGLVCGEAVLTEEEKALGVALLDFGGGTTDLAIFAGNSLRYSSVIPVAGNNITNDIAVGLQTSLPNAEALKREYGCCLNALGDQEEAIEIPGLGGRRPRSISRRELAEIIHLRLSELLGLIAKEIHRAGPAHPVLAGAVICGGSSLIPGLEQLVEETLNLPARVGYPLVTGGLTDVMRDPAYATGVGLVLYGHRLQQGGSAGRSRGGRIRGGKGGVWSRLKKWFQEVV